MCAEIRLPGCFDPQYRENPYQPIFWVAGGKSSDRLITISVPPGGMIRSPAIARKYQRYPDYVIFLDSTATRVVDVYGASMFTLPAAEDVCHSAEI